MDKKIIISLSLFLSSASLAAVSVVLSLGQSSLAASETGLYQNPVSLYELRKRADKKLEIFDGQKKVAAMDGTPLVSRSPKTSLINSQSSILNYFYQISGSANPLAVYSQKDGVLGLAFEEKTLGLFLNQSASGINSEAQNAKLEIKDGAAVEFAPDLPGRKLDIAASANLIRRALVQNGQTEIALAVSESPPEIKLAETNELGIVRLIGRGASDFSGSSQARIHNIRVGAARYDGLIIKPGEQFSFNDYLGPVTAATGFLPELVIKAEGTVPEFGGGLCQVSSTAFRAAFFSGTRIDERKNHSYAVKYYKWINDELPLSEGMDATIYPGVVDMKFTNDTQGSILITTYIEGDRLYFDFYGTPDDRQVVLTGPETFDRQASGALKARVVRKVIKDGVAHEDIFNSVYVSPDKFPRTYEYTAEKEPGPPQPEAPFDQTVIN